MAALLGRKILVGISGGIAAYKTAYLIRQLRGEGAQVRVVMTQAAEQFITPMTLQALSGQPVRQSLFDPAHEAAMGHIELARWADLILVAPASADYMARMAAGMADDLLATICLATEVPIALAPAMNQGMWRNSATCQNARTLLARGVRLWGPSEGDQACGESGPGRMLEPEQLMQLVRQVFSTGAAAGLKVLLTAGPTREPIDPVRFISNRSSGKMGFALAMAFSAQGADVTLITGPVTLETPAGVRRLDVETALEMEAAVMSEVEGCDIFVGCAAVADYRPAHAVGQKIKKTAQTRDIELVRNPDILAAVAARAKPPFTVGFAAETERPVEYAQEKRKAKGVDMIAANLVAAAEGGFERDENSLIVLWEGGRKDLPMTDKPHLAQLLVTQVLINYEKKHSAEDT
ncbi:MAG: bifunctional phosphopantothenoylcysteine decarboxylase/phosphopantothenate--cysteine ligase CoaBC [Chromatiaceae bacterium]|nr:bifunctional phosphopantothenoylcysteine decarboxylase/phosphopantothenate--cysteine ligase CoaBC [Chromatiaceae bacterium]MCP5444610.1 bifunctional phosphopantothenoylcysteine decarboxylase/phosphopantothenate--cysteine ligase CoaBC [Chromatiaceae bacterium]